MPISNDVVNVRFIRQLRYDLKKGGEIALCSVVLKMKTSTESNLKYEIYKRLLSTIELRLTKERKNKHSLTTLLIPWLSDILSFSISSLKFFFFSFQMFLLSNRSYLFWYFFPNILWTLFQVKHFLQILNFKGFMTLTI